MSTLLETFVNSLQGVDRRLERGEPIDTVLEEVMASVNGLSPDFSFRLDHDEGEHELTWSGVRLGAYSIEGDPPPLVVSLFAREVTYLLHKNGRERRQARDLERLTRAGRMVSSSFDLESTLRAILSMALEVTGAKYGIFRLLDPEKAQLETAAVAGENLDAPLVEALSLEGEHVTGWVARHRTSLRIDDLARSPWAESYVPLDEALEMRAELTVPLLGMGDRLEGVLNLESPNPGAFTSNDQRLLETFAGHAVMAIQQARLLDALQEIAEGVLEWPCERVLERVVALCRHLLGASGVVLEHSTETLRDGLQEGERVEMTIESEGRLVAFLSEPSEWEEKVLRCLAHHAGLALRNARRVEELRASQQRQALTETFAAMGDLSANLLHQLNNKVGVIPVRVEGILDKCVEEVSESPYLERNLKEIEASAQRALEIVRQNLSILKPRESGLIHLNLCLRRAVKELGLSELLRGELEVPQIKGDVRSITLVFVNLLENAARVLPASGRVTVMGAVENERVVVRVEDNGPGVPLERQEEIFRLKSDRSRPHNLGFGLWWVRTLMERIGGSISLESDGQSGSTFVLEFPLP